jgi:carbon-monoxide dehydrogenase large subunit
VVHRKWIGKRIPRLEDEIFLRGKAKYVADIQLPNMLYAAVVRSQYAHARLKRVDVTKAKQLSGVVDVITGEELRRHIKMNLGEFWTVGGPGKSSM